MTGWLSTHRTLRAALLVSAGVLVGLVLLAFILAGVDRITGDAGGDADPATGPSPTTPDRASPPASAASPVRSSPEPSDPASDDRPVAGALPALPATDDPDVYAAAVAEVLLGMDYTNRGPADYEAFFESGLWDEIVSEDRTRLMATISRRIPTPDMWEQMRSVEQTSEFDVELVWEPRTGRAHREAGDWPEGVLTQNVSGTQTETWRAPDDETQSSTREMAVTIGLACPPASSPCRLLSIQPNVES